MRPDQCVTAVHIDVWHERVLPRDTTPITLGMILRGSLLPILVWSGVGGFLSFAFNPAVTMAFAGLFVLFVLVGFLFRRKAKHSVRCSIYGAIAGVFRMSTEGF
jgi:hypothetical protein